MKTKKIGIIGLGTVGEGTLEILTKERNIIHKKTGVWVDVKKACDLNIDRNFDFDFDKNILTTDYKEIINDSEISIVVELIGGDTIAKKIIIDALKSKKHVVTANKALIAKHSKELFALADKNNVKIYYEASVGGGIPILTPLQESLVGNNILGIKGIINGTANYILSEMTEKGLAFDKVLADAQSLGYAEADPTFDIEGIDTAHKITILSSLAYGGYIDVNNVPVRGITKITKEDIEFADKAGYNIKLLAIAKKDNDEIEISVEPTLITKKEILASVDGVYNAVEVIGDYVGKTMFYGKGAGMTPTGSAVVADIVKLAIEDGLKETVQGEYHYDIKNELKIKDLKETYSKYYIRLNVEDKLGILSFITNVFKENNISIESVIQNTIKKSSNYTSLILTTHTIKREDLENSIIELEKEKRVNMDKSIFIKIDN